MRRGGASPDRGEATTQLVLLTPVLLVLLLSVVQLALWVHSAHVATAAAAEAVGVSARVHGSAGAAAAAATAVVEESGGRLAAPAVVERSSRWTTSVVRVGVPRVLPGFPSEVARRASGPVERFVPEDGS